MTTSHTLYSLITEMGDHLVLHGDGVKDIAFNVVDCRALYKVMNLDILSFIM